jgi:Tfp pilus assembly protein PilE
MLKKHQRGFTVIELLTCGAVVAWLAFLATVIYVAFHFISKLW